MKENPYYILSVEEAMEELQIGRNAIYDILRSGKLKGFKIGRNWKSPVNQLINTSTKTLKGNQKNEHLRNLKIFNSKINCLKSS